MEYMTAVPHLRSEAAGPARSGRRSLAVALLSGALGAAVALLSTRQSWSEGTATVAGGAFPLTAKGSDVTGVPAALAIVGLAALVAVFAVRSSGRFLVSALLALSGAGTVVAAVLGASDSSALDEKAAAASGDTAATASALSHTAWPYAAAAGGALILLAGLLALRYGRLWPAMSGRYERDGTPRPRKAKPVDPDRPEDIWKALDRGEDPTGPDPAGT
ncbi:MULTISPECIES: TIGR02234 family membrane protein [Streptomyces]|uniref:TIGR02234 family membrane protein n=1 Tax=Streptomyces TaxID=1883 RepID=UPI000EB5B358|nr:MULTISPECIES: TIGR02234 family membrane protein [Streptomyces]MCX4433168.1 TIGR02234 family membrane protein [Streptomyces mirabilis]